MELALLHAVRKSDVKCVEILLRFHGIPSIQTDPPGVVRCLGVKRQRYITPLTLAACLQNFRIVELFLKNGFTICDPQTDAQQSVNSNGALNEKLGPAVFRLNRYRALFFTTHLTVPFAFIALAFLTRSCVTWLRKECLELSDGCEEFPVALLNECRSMKEIKCVVEM